MSEGEIIEGAPSWSRQPFSEEGVWSNFHVKGGIWNEYLGLPKEIVNVKVEAHPVIYCKWLMWIKIMSTIYQVLPHPCDEFQVCSSSFPIAELYQSLNESRFVWTWNSLPPEAVGGRFCIYIRIQAWVFTDSLLMSFSREGAGDRCRLLRGLVETILEALCADRPVRFC